MADAQQSQEQIASLFAQQAQQFRQQQLGMMGAIGAAANGWPFPGPRGAAVAVPFC